MTDDNEAVRCERERWITDTSYAAAKDAKKLIDKLRKGGDARTAVEFGEEAFSLWPTYKIVQGALAWAYYDRDIKVLDPETATDSQRNVAKASLARVQQLEDVDPYSEYSAWPQAVLKLAHGLVSNSAADALDLLIAVDPLQLSAEQTSDFPVSKAERWHMYVTKALGKLERWDELLSRCDRALALDGILSRDNRVWIKRRRGLALEGLGRLSDAAIVLREVCLEKPTWSNEADLARVLEGAGMKDEAIGACRRALSEPGSLAWRWKTVFRLARLLENADKDLAGLHYQFASHLRVEAGWKPRQDLEESSRSIGLGGDPPKSVALKDLRAYWSSHDDSSRTSGVVTKVFTGDHSGFVTSDEGMTGIYFNMPQPPVTVGSRVTFRMAESFDKKKNQPGMKAVDIRGE